MASIPVFVGLDYHQDAVQVCVVDGSGRVLANQSVANSSTVVAALVTRHGRPQAGPSRPAAARRHWPTS